MFKSILQSCGMKQHVNETTHVFGHTRDIVINQDVDIIVSMVGVSDLGLSDALVRYHGITLAVI